MNSRAEITAPLAFSMELYRFLKTSPFQAIPFYLAFDRFFLTSFNNDAYLRSKKQLSTL